MATDPNRQGAPPWQDWAQSYATTLSQAYNPAIESARQRLAGYLTPEQLTSNIANLFSGAMQSAGQVGERAGAAGAQLTGTLAAGLGNLPGLDPNAIPLLLRGTSRAGATAALTGEALRGQAQLAQNLATQQALARREEGMRADQGLLADLQTQQGTAVADWLKYAQERQGMYSQTLQNEQIAAQTEQIRKETASLPPAQVARRIAERLARNEVTLGALQAQGAIQELKSSGVNWSKMSGALKNAGFTQGEIKRFQKIWG